MSTPKNKKPNTSHITVVKKMKDYSNEPVFQKKHAEAIAFLNKHGLPKEMGSNKK